MTAKKPVQPPDDVYDHTVVSVFQDPDYDPLWGLPSIVSPVKSDGPVVAPESTKES